MNADVEMDIALTRHTRNYVIVSSVALKICIDIDGTF